MRLTKTMRANVEDKRTEQVKIHTASRADAKGQSQHHSGCQRKDRRRASATEGKVHRRKRVSTAARRAALAQRSGKAGAEERAPAGPQRGTGAQVNTTKGASGGNGHTLQGVGIKKGRCRTQCRNTKTRPRTLEQRDNLTIQKSSRR